MLAHTRIRDDLEAWNSALDATCGSFRARLDPELPMFIGDLDHQKDEHLEISAIRTNAGQIIHRRRSSDQHDERWCFLVMQRSGRAQMRYPGQRAFDMHAGEMMLMDSIVPCDIIPHGLIDHVSIHLDRSELQRHLAPGQHLFGKIPTGNVSGQLLHGMVRQLLHAGDALSRSEGHTMQEVIILLLSQALRQDTCAGAISVEASRLDAVMARLPGGNGQLAADASVVAEQNARIAGDSANATAIQAVTASVAGKADASVVQSMGVRVSGLEATGSNQNLLTNTTFNSGTRGWVRDHVPAMWTAPEVNYGGDAHRPAGLNNLGIGGADVAFWPGQFGQLRSSRVAAIPGQRYLASCCILNYRCNAQVLLCFRYADGTYSGIFYGPVLNQLQDSPGTSQQLNHWHRSAVVEDAAVHVGEVMDRGDLMEPGTFATSPDQQQLLMHSPPVGPVVCDVSSIGLINGEPKPATLQQALTDLFARVGFTAWSSTDAAAIDAATGYAGIGYYASEPATARSALHAILASYGAWYYRDAAGVLRFVRIIAPESTTPAFELTASDLIGDLKRATDTAPNLTRRVAYRPNAQALGASELVTDLEDLPQARRDQLTALWRGQGYAAGPLPPRYAHADSAEPFISTLWRQQDAQREAERVIALYAQERATHQITVNGHLNRIPTPGEVGLLRYPKYGLNTGLPVLVRRVEHRSDRSGINLLLWG